MSVPRNNLADLLKLKANNALNSPQTYTPPSRTRSGPKFKPAISTSTTSTMPGAPSSLPSFSTPGFRRAKPPPIQTAMPDPIVISDYSNPPTPNALKRTSSDPDVVSDPSPQAHKRPKKTRLDKENLSPTDFCTNSKEAKSTFISRLVSSVAASSVPNLPRGQDPSRPSWMEAHLDLMEVPSENLDNYKNKHLELLTHVLRLLVDGGLTASVDIKALSSIRTDLEKRMDAIDWVVAHKKGNQPNLTMLPATFPSNQPPSSQTLSTPVVTPPERITNPSIQCPPQNPASIVPSLPSTKVHTQPIDPEEEFGFESYGRAKEPDSDEELWDSFGDMPASVFDAVTRPPVRLPAAAVGHSEGLDMQEVRRQLKGVFGLKDFRPNQLEAITATLEGRDVFVLMPTGGGKSLCYQLPAVCVTGKTCGVTVVVSPLTALMEDQVGALTSKGVDAFFWSADSLQHEVSAKLFSGDKKPSLLYVTPEKLRASSACRNLLNKLYREQQLARFAIDEAHCISTWGQDFRSAYQGLGQFREEYPDVPIIALTATANQRTREDIVNQLRLRDHAFFTQSFNRPNLRYVIKSKRNVLNDIVDFIQREHPNKSGVIYCQSRKSCEQLAGQLAERGMKAEFFHAGLSKDIKNRHLENWKADKFHIIVATIAFGMGIDKPDVRFVIHYDMPKSLSGYYQETGRAGRDRKPADCVLYYSFKDFKTICWMIENDKDREEPLTPEGRERQIDAAREVLKYCNNISECRRIQVLRHFGQEFDPRDCHGGCDNCLDARMLVEEDVTIVANNAVDIVQSVSEAGTNITVLQLVQFLRGLNGTKLRERGLEDMIGFGNCKHLTKELVELALDRLLASDILTTRRESKGQYGYMNEYVELGSAGASFKSRGERFKVEWRPPPPKMTKPSKQNQERQGKGKRRAMDLPGDDPIEPFPDEENVQNVVGASRQSPEQASLSPKDEESLPDSMFQLYGKLDNFRQQIMVKEGLAEKSMVIGEALLQSLCFTCPRDFLEFTRIANEAADELTPSFFRNRDEILQLCIQHQIESSRKMAEMHSRFAFHPAPTNGRP